MSEKTLIAYASKYGATREIAEKIGETLRQAGLAIEVLPVDRVRDIVPYRAVVLGSAIYIGKWPKEAVTFLHENKKDLAARSVWLFSSGPTGEGDPVELVDGQRLPAALQTVVDRIHPRDVAVFHGFINPAKFNFMETFAINSVVKKPMGDFRDWRAIERWARSIAERLVSNAHQSSRISAVQSQKL